MMKKLLSVIMALACSLSLFAVVVNAYNVPSDRFVMSPEADNYEIMVKGEILPDAIMVKMKPGYVKFGEEHDLKSIFEGIDFLDGYENPMLPAEKDFALVPYVLVDYDDVDHSQLSSVRPSVEELTNLYCMDPWNIWMNNLTDTDKDAVTWYYNPEGMYLPFFTREFFEKSYENLPQKDALTLEDFLEERYQSSPMKNVPGVREAIIDGDMTVFLENYDQSKHAAIFWIQLFDLEEHREMISTQYLSDMLDAFAAHEGVWAVSPVILKSSFFGGGGDDVVIPGDVNGDGALTIRDPALLMRYLAGWDVTAEISDLSKLDVDGNGSVNARDVAIMMRTLSGWSD